MRDWDAVLLRGYIMIGAALCVGWKGAENIIHWIHQLLMWSVS